LIFDEVISGFRIGFEGASGYYSIRPDIITFGKIIGGGMPVGAYGGSKEIMSHIAPDGPVYQAGTLSANPVAMAAGIAALKQLLASDFYEKLEHKTKVFCAKIQSHVEKKNYPMHMVHIGSIFWFAFSKSRIFSADQIDAAGMEKFKVLHHELLERGIYLGPSGYEVGFVSAAHTESELSEAATTICKVLDIVFE
jgi:glutamate-1-semialdehyde 2,1-aminomutase